MKKKILLMACFVMTCLSSFAETRAAIVVLHNGNGTTFDAGQLKDAMNLAVTGDTIYLTEGTFDVDTLIVDKPVTIMGAGEISKIRGGIYVAIDDNPLLNQYMFDALNIQGSVKITKELRGLKMRKCKMTGTLYASNDIKDLQVDRCNIFRLLPSKQIKNASFVNSYFEYVGGHNLGEFAKEINRTSSLGNDLVFFNCTIYNVMTYIYGSNNNDICLKDAGLINCNVFIYNESNNSGTCSLTNTVLYNCSSVGTENIVQNCYFVGSIGDSAWKTLTASSLVSSGYVGLDGTAVGHLGGTTPYSLQPLGINVTESQLKVDNENKQLNVTLKISANQ